MPQRTPVLLLASMTLLLVPVAGQACSCGWSGPFVKMAQRSDLVVRGKVVRYHGQVKHPNSKPIPLAMDIEVLETLRGSAGRRTIRVWGDNGMLCRPYVTRFPRGTTWILALARGTNDSSRVPAGDYAISVCGEYWLKSTGMNAAGLVTVNDPKAAAQSVSLARLRALLKEKS